MKEWDWRLKVAISWAIVLVAMSLTTFVTLFAGTAMIQGARVDLWCAPGQVQWEIVGEFEQRGCIETDQSITVEYWRYINE